MLPVQLRNIRRVIGLCICVLSLSVSFAAVRRVPQDYASIQGALDAVVDDDTVLVSLGTYAEELMAPPLRFWLLGDVPIDTGDFTRPLIDPSTLDSAAWRCCLKVPQASQATVERMAFVNRASMFPAPDSMQVKGIRIQSVLPVIIRQCRFDSVFRAIACPGFEDSSYQFFVEDCRFTHALRAQVRALHRGTVSVLRCQFEGRQSISPFVHAGTFSRVEECIFNGHPTNGAVYLDGAGLVVRNCIFGPLDSLGNWAALTASSTSGAVIESNLFHAMQCGYRAVMLDDNGGEPLVIRDNQLTGLSTWYWPQATVNMAITTIGSFTGVRAVIDSNLFQGNSQPSEYGAKAVFPTGGTMYMTANRFVDLEPVHGPTVDNSLGSDGSQLRFNQFEAGDLAVRSFPYALDAVNNYWGDASGPYNALHNPAGQGASVDDAVLFEPWSPDTNFLAVPGLGKPLPEAFILDAYPNPFNSTVHLTLVPSKSQIVKLELFDILGRRVEEVWRGPLAFQRELSFDASALSSGIYLARVTDVIDRKPLATTKLVVLK